MEIWRWGFRGFVKNRDLYRLLDCTVRKLDTQVSNLYHV